MFARLKQLCVSFLVAYVLTASLPAVACWPSAARRQSHRIIFVLVQCMSPVLADFVASLFATKSALTRPTSHLKRSGPDLGDVL
jgi:hypothetical protein